MYALQENLDRVMRTLTHKEHVRNAIVTLAEQEGREDLTVSETRAFKDLSIEIDDLQGRAIHLQGEIERSGRGSEDPHLSRAIRKNGRGSGPGGVGGIPTLNFDEDQMRSAWSALSQGQRYRVEQRAFSTVDSLLPPFLSPYVVGPIHESRLLARLPDHADRFTRGGVHTP